MTNDNKKITNNKTKNTKTTKKTTGTSKKPAAKKTNTVKKATVSKAATSKTTQKKKTTSNAKKKTNVVTTKKAAKKVANSTNNKTKNSAKKSVPKKSTQKKETKKEEKKVIEQPKVSEIKKEEKKEKKISISTNTIYTIIGLAVLAIVLVLTIFIKPTDSNDDSNNSEPTTVTSSPADENIPEDKRKELNSIDIDQYLDMLKGEETKVIYIGRPTCGHCVKQKPVMENIKYEYDVEINYLNTDELNEDGINKLISSNEYFSEGFGTPLTLIVKDNKILDKAVGETSKKDMIELFKKYSLIK